MSLLSKCCSHGVLPALHSFRSFCFQGPLRRYRPCGRRDGCTALLVDGDAIGVATTYEAIDLLKDLDDTYHDGQVKTLLFAAPRSRTNREWQRLIKRHHVELREVHRSRYGEPSDEAILMELKCLASSTPVSSIALLTRDRGFANMVSDILAAKKVLVLIPATSQGTAEVYKATGAEVFLLEASKFAYKVRAILHPDGRGTVQRIPKGLVVPSGEDLESMHHAAKELLKKLGYIQAEEESVTSSISAIAKFWFANSLGSLTVYPNQCAVEVLHQTLLRDKSRKWCSSGRNLAFFLPVVGVRKFSGEYKRRVEEHGNELAYKIFEGGGPFVLKDSADMVKGALTRLKYLNLDSRSLNSDVMEAMQVFANTSRNKANLRNMSLMPSPNDTLDQAQLKLRRAFLSNKCGGAWQMPVPDLAIRYFLLNRRLIPSISVSEPVVLNAMQKFGQSQRLPEMKTYNGYVSQLGHLITADDPARRDMPAFARKR